jgi:tRNA (guanine37-N1)-methyltransferase
MRISILTLFPEMFIGPFSCSIIKRATQQGAVTISVINIRDYALDKHKSVDDRPYGGGKGMIMRVDVMDSAINATIANTTITREKTRIILLDPKGAQYTQLKAKEYSLTYGHIILVCPHYEGVDERIRSFVDEQISVGDYIVTGGELPAMVIVDSVIRLLPGVLDPIATADESFTDPQSLEYPQYTRPEIYHDMKVPERLLSGDHALIKKWKTRQARIVTKNNRPDLLKKTNR